jgi:hypothetical protein
MNIQDDSTPLFTLISYHCEKWEYQGYGESDFKQASELRKISCFSLQELIAEIADELAEGVDSEQMFIISGEPFDCSEYWDEIHCKRDQILARRKEKEKEKEERETQEQKRRKEMADRTELARLKALYEANKYSS